ncbi:MAG: mannose-6-phosphate isomerase [Actinomycetota bacterium]|nr:mannose-6-phosphate isomerase [Actinomycetota bacterium]
MTTSDDALLDSAEVLAAADAGGMLRAIATAGAQLRQSARLAREAGVGRIAEDGRPRAVLAVGMGGSGIAGEIARAIAGQRCPVPVLASHAPTLPGWVGPTDLVFGVSCSGATPEVLTAMEEAVRRGCRVVTVGSERSPLAALAEQARAIHVPVDACGRLPRANVWALSVPLLAALHVLGLAAVPDDVIESTADAVDALAARLGPATPPAHNAAKKLAAELAGALPVVWGSGEVSDAAAYRFACQLNENAKLPVLHGALPEIAHNQVVALDGPFAAAASEVDFFRDRVDEPDGRPAMRVVLLRDVVEDPYVAAQRKALVGVAERRATPVHELVAEGDHPLERLASLVVTGDLVSVYVALLQGTDPTPIAPIDELKGRLGV